MKASTVSVGRGWGRIMSCLWSLECHAALIPNMYSCIIQQTLALLANQNSFQCSRLEISKTEIKSIFNIVCLLF